MSRRASSCSVDRYRPVGSVSSVSRLSSNDSRGGMVHEVVWEVGPGSAALCDAEGGHLARYAPVNAVECWAEEHALQNQAPQ